MSIEITEVNDKLRVVSPYDKNFIAKAKAIGGKWNSGFKVWEFDCRDQKRVEELLGEVYGWISPINAGNEVVTVRVDLRQWKNESRAFAFGREIARKPDRDNIYLGPGVVVVEGVLQKRGGSQRNPCISNSGVIVEVRDIPVGALDLAREQDIDFEIVEDSNDINENMLRQERAMLKARIKEIDLLIGEEK